MAAGLSHVVELLHRKLFAQSEAISWNIKHRLTGMEGGCVFSITLNHFKHLDVAHRICCYKCL